MRRMVNGPLGARMVPAMRSIVEPYSLRDAEGGWILTGPSKEAPYAPVLHEKVFVDLGAAIEEFITGLTMQNVEGLMAFPGTDDGGARELILNASEKAVTGFRVQNGFVISFRQRPDEAGVFKTSDLCCTKVFTEPPLKEIADFFQNPMDTKADDDAG